MLAAGESKTSGKQGRDSLERKGMNVVGGGGVTEPKLGDRQRLRGQEVTRDRHADRQRGRLERQTGSARASGVRKDTREHTSSTSTSTSTTIGTGTCEVGKRRGENRALRFGGGRHSPHIHFLRLDRLGCPNRLCRCRGKGLLLPTNCQLSQRNPTSSEVKQ
jgi:hypothetical protein